MSGRGRGGFRGGRGGRGGRPTNGTRTLGRDDAPFQIDADVDVVLDGKPSELFPPYDVPKAPNLTKKEEKQVQNFLVFREQCHDSPLYTEARAWNKGTTGANKRTYGQEQINKRYQEENFVDPFTAVPMYTQQFLVAPRTLPDLSSRPFAKEFFPPELHSTLDGTSSNKRRKLGKSLGLSNITSYKTAEDLDLEQLAAGMLLDASTEEGAQDSLKKALEFVKNAEEAGEDGVLYGDEDDDWVKNNGDNEDGEGGEGQEEVEDEYDDESEDDYNAEQYFDGNQDDDFDDEGVDDGDAYF